MRWWPGWDLRKDPFAEGQIWDLRTYGGVLRFMILYGIGLWGAWNIDNFFAWLQLRGYRDGVDPRVQQWHRFGVISLAIVGYGGALGGMIAIFLRRRRERQIRESAKGQWYDRTGLTREDLYDAASDAPESDGEGG